MNFKSIWCRLGFHRWSPWVKRVMPAGVKLLMWRDRSCLACGMYQSVVEQ